MTNEFREELVELLPRLRRFAYGLAGHRDDADDLVQTACERALDRADQWEPGTRLDSWMFRIVQNLWFDRLRSRKVRGEQVDESALEHQADEQAHRLPEVRSTFARVAAQLDTLKPEDRQRAAQRAALFDAEEQRLRRLLRTAEFQALGLPR